MRKRKTRQQLLEEFNKLDFTSDFMFTNLMQDEELCKKIIKVLLNINVDRIVHHKTQKLVKVNMTNRGVRFDAYVEDENRIFDIEMQCCDYDNLPKRARYYQGIIDVSALKQKQDFRDLKESFVIFICRNDPLKAGIPIYTIEQKVREAPNFEYDDYSRKIFYNCSAWKLCEEEETMALLKYLSTQESSSSFTDELKAIISKAKESLSLREKFMSFRERRIEREIDEAEMRAEARWQGLEEGRSQGLQIGLTEGREQGLSEGRAAGLTEGRAEGERNARIDTARKMLKADFDIAQIAELTELSLEEIEALR